MNKISRIAHLSDFIKKANNVHDDKYDYILAEYINNKTKIKILCPVHGVFKQTPDNHVHNRGCPICGIEINRQHHFLTTNNFINKANKIHNNKYDYSLVSYIDTKTKIKIICPIHGIFEQIPQSHLSGSGCSKCVKKYRFTSNEFNKNANIIHNYLYNYKLVNYVNAKTKIKIICKKHGIFKQLPRNHLCGKGCPICTSSKGEIKIGNILKLNNIKFVQEKIFKNCKNKISLPFDFYLPEHNILIEYDGIQHEKPINFHGISDERAELAFKMLKHNDDLKNDYAKNQNIKLIRISYIMKNVEKILINNLNL
jgi:very-short-patch-repair endonuclease